MKRETKWTFKKEGFLLQNFSNKTPCQEKYTGKMSDSNLWQRETRICTRNERKTANKKKSRRQKETLVPEINAKETRFCKQKPI